MRVLFVLAFITLFYSSFLNAQTDTTRGISFERRLNWNQILTKAKSEKKLIFLDCYATWCKPCKIMADEIYTLANVGNIFNSSFISVKVQMDTTPVDSGGAKDWYRFAQQIGLKFKISRYPSLLFFNSDDELIYRDDGYKDEKEIISIAEMVSDPQKQYHSLLNNYFLGIADNPEIEYLAKLAKKIGNDSLAKEIADHYLSELHPDEIFTSENIQFMREFTVNSRSPGFYTFYSFSRKIDSVMKDDDYSETAISNIIIKEEINPMISVTTMLSADHSWDRIAASIAKKYNRYYSNRCITSAKIEWYSSNNNWPLYVRSILSLVENSSEGTKANGFYINNMAWEVVQHSNNKKQLKVAISWMEHLFELYKWINKKKQVSPQAFIWGDGMDTYACLLYQIGEVKRAIKVEESILAVSKRPDIQQHFSKMSNRVKITLFN